MATAGRSPDRLAAVTVLLAAVLALAWPAGRAAEIAVMTAGPTRAPLAAIGSASSAASGHSLRLIAGSAGALQQRVARGESADVIVATAAGLDVLARLGVVDGDSIRPIGRDAVGIAVRAGQRPPDLGSRDALMHALLAARSIVHGDPMLNVPSGVHMMRVVERLGILYDLNPRTDIVPTAAEGLARVARGESELAVALTTEIAAQPGTALAGPFPDDLQESTGYAAGLLRRTAQADLARAFIAYLGSASSRERLRAAGLLPPR